ncbi:hypothetical protein CA54_60470 [Symmachiella macrocystis]|uniref:Phorbol-ester/DAG-type domain-containing protein n=1 Tax=Symmachiella macrocystis TaxID=2527985 RepID=A0A5C6AVV8_9PLAN|nr:RING finger protein [Symmachiella macrocystis]TWU04165.1 hypothetical protein CA54_60470 [Symmachiella macrocystis]
MSNIIQCECGASIRLPSNTEKRALRCPKCKQGIALTVHATALKTVPVDAGETVATCSICQSSAHASEQLVSCPQCDQIHHQECWAEVGGCGTYGCSEAPAHEKDVSSSQTQRSGWGDEKTCPACSESIKSIALRCRYCGTDFNTVDPLTVKDLRRQVKHESAVGDLRNWTIAIFVMSLIGCFAPIMIFVAFGVLLNKRKELKAAGPIYLVLCYSAAILSAIYSFLMLAFAIISGLN